MVIRLIKILLLSPFFLYSQDNVKYSKTINKEDLKIHLEILASDSLEGRETGKKGQKLAAEYIKNHFINIGIPPSKGNTYYQKFKVQSDRHICKYNCENCDEDFITRLFKKSRIVNGENVLGFIEGTDLKEEIVLITAHYDHLGKHDTLLFNGADDNGSGTAAVLEIAEAFMIAKKEGNGPRRSVLIMPVSGEEKGLLGSKHYSENPVYPLEKTIVNLNIDMIGRIDYYNTTADYIYLIGSDMLSQELHDLSEQINKEYIGLTLDYTFNSEDDPNRYYYRSDHYNFAKNNIPVIFYFNGLHDDYHKPTDTIEKIDFNKTETITRLVFLTAWELANRDERIKLNNN